MKRLCFVCMCLLLIGTASPAIADLTGIQILSEGYHVWGDYYVNSYLDGTVYSDSYNLGSNDSSGISGSVSSESILDPYVPYVGAESSAGRFFANAHTSGNSGQSNSWATASVSFQPETSGWLHVGASASSMWHYAAHAALSDSTAGIPLFDFWDNDSPHSVYGDFLVYDTHTYSLSLSAWSSQGDGASANANLSFTPEPATLLLFGLGAAIVRRKR